MKLLFDPSGEPDPPYILDIAGPRPESESIQCVDDKEIGAEFPFEWIGGVTGPR
jgi:hypothetical protein